MNIIEYIVYGKDYTVLVYEVGFVYGFRKYSHSSFIWKEDVEVCRIDKVVIMSSPLVRSELA
jgi:hypothetical protein